MTDFSVAVVPADGGEVKMILPVRDVPTTAPGAYRILWQATVTGWEIIAHD